MFFREPLICFQLFFKKNDVKSTHFAKLVWWTLYAPRLISLCFILLCMRTTHHFKFRVGGILYTFVWFYLVMHANVVLIKDMHVNWSFANLEYFFRFFVLKDNGNGLCLCLCAFDGDWLLRDLNNFNLFKSLR